MAELAQLFGTRRRTQILEAIALLEETHAAELAAVLTASPYVVQRILKELEREGVIEGRRVGRERRINLSKRYFGYKPLKELLIQMGMRDPEVDEAVSSLRRRARAQGKAI